MRIYKMTATFGKLEHQSLTLEPGLNIITAPNEWGKSTWCAFLIAMFYGVDTRAKTTKNILADKDHYTPWSGSPMSGRIDLNWQGRDITIERTTKRRIPLGEFRAYETATGLTVKELTAANCGQMLLGVEQTVFRRAGFIRQADLPVTQDEALRRRLNALVTTGDESGAADRLAVQLKELKNRCRYNRSGLLPQAEAERDALEGKLSEMESLEAQCKKMKLRIEEVKSWLEQLYNHQQALAYQEAEENAARVAQARETLEQGEKDLTEREAACAKLAPREEAEQKVRDLRLFREEWNAMQAEVQRLPQEPEKPQMPQPFTGMEPEEARVMAQRDARTFVEAKTTKTPGILMGIGIFGLLAAGVLILLTAYAFAGVAGGAAAIALIWGISEAVSAKKRAKNLERKYGSAQCKHWEEPVDEYEQAKVIYEKDLRRFKECSGDVEVRMMVLRKKRDSLCGDQEPDALLDFWQQTVVQWDGYYAARREVAQNRKHFETLQAMVKPVEKPTKPDHLTQSEAETAQLLTECAVEQQRLQNRLGQYQGRMETLGDKQEIGAQLEQKKKRISQLEETYTALTIALETLNQARSELQRRFAPRITKRAQKLLSQMTGGRYHSLIMREDFTLQSGAGEEDTLHDSLWRSDGTIDQLYLALRLAVAEELTPEIPLILDDALVRFDDARMKAALDILRDVAKNRQVICFTCQNREKQAQ